MTSPSFSLSPELARQNPEAFKWDAIHEAGKLATHGAEIINYAVASGVVDPSRIEIQPDRWHSQSQALGNMWLGVAPMDAATKSRIHFRDHEFDYPAQISWRLLHETNHGTFFLTQHDQPVRNILEMATSVRQATDGKLGLTALGSLDYYDDAKKKGLEDTVELLTMHMWSPKYARAYYGFLGDPRYESVRQRHGIISLAQPLQVYDAVARATDHILDRARRV